MPWRQVSAARTGDRCVEGGFDVLYVLSDLDGRRLLLASDRLGRLVEELMERQHRHHDDQIVASLGALTAKQKANWRDHTHRTGQIDGSPVSGKGVGRKHIHTTSQVS